MPVTHNLHYHALLTSHHLKAPSKRRSLQQWAGELSLIGFAKVGHPGVIYCEGMQAQVEEFVTNVKALQWLALRVRFIEPLPEACQNTVGQAESKNCANDRQEVAPRKQWVEFEKVGQVVEEMKRLKREHYVVEMGIGSTSSSLSTY